MIAKSCVFCDKNLENAYYEDNDYQPHAGGYVKFTFGYGSCKFDNAIGYTTFGGYICDDCAEKYIGKMEERRFGVDGEPLIGKDYDNGAKM